VKKKPEVAYTWWK